MLRPAAIAILLSAIVQPVTGQEWRQLVDEANDKVNSGQYEEALDIVERLLGNVNFTAADVIRTSVETYTVLGRYDRAEQATIRFAANNPTSSEYANTLGEVYQLRGKLDEADQAFRKAIRGGATDSLRAELNLALLQDLRGQRDSSLARLDRFIDYYNSNRGSLSSDQLATVATAARHLGVRDPGLFEDAVRVYDEAISADSRNMTARVAIGDLLLDKYNNTEAREAYQQALSLNPNHPEALLGSARSMHFDGASEAMETAQRVLEINEDHVDARVFLARLFVELESYDEALAEINHALRVNPGALNALATRAAIEYLTDDHAAFVRTERDVLRRNPRYAELYNTLAELGARNRLYGEAVRFARRAVELDPTSTRAHSLLGMNQLRTGAIAEGRRSLEFSFEGDPYNVWVKNTLDLMDTFSEYDINETERFHLVVYGTESAALTPYLAEVAEEAYEALSQRYGYEPPTPIRVEVYPRHADFSVRTVGLAGMGALGVSFGNVIAMDSPSARNKGEFNWGSTLWHEIAHTFHLGLTKHKVPRWFSEGLAVYEERRAKEGWGDDASVSFLIALRDEHLLDVSELNNGFVRPTYPNQIIHSYYQASLVCEFIEQEGGPTALTQMLRGYANGKNSSEVIEDVVGMNVGEFDRAFERFMDDRFEAVVEALGDWSQGIGDGGVDAAENLATVQPWSFPTQIRAARMLFDAGRVSDATPYFEKARDLFPEYAAHDSPYWYLGQIYRDAGRVEEAVVQLKTLTGLNANDHRAYLLLAELRESAGDTRGAADALARAQFVDPFNLEDHQRLASLLEQTDDWTAAVGERRVVVALDPVDITEARYRLALALFRSGEMREARREILRTLERAPNYEAAQDLLLEIRERLRSDVLEDAA